MQQRTTNLAKAKTINELKLVQQDTPHQGKTNDVHKQLNFAQKAVMMSQLMVSLDGHTV